MVLANPNIYYRTIRDALLSLMRAEKASLNSGLVLGTFNREVEQIKAGSPLSLPVKNIIYPTILVKMESKDEEFLNLGNAGRKRPVIKYKFYGLVKNILTSGEPDNDIMQLTSNVEGIFRNNIQVNNNVLWGQITRTEFGLTEVFDNFYIDIVSMDYTCVVEVK